MNNNAMNMNNNGMNLNNAQEPNVLAAGPGANAGPAPNAGGQNAALPNNNGGIAAGPPNNFAEFNAMIQANPVPILNMPPAVNPFPNLGGPGPALGPQHALGAGNHFNLAPQQLNFGQPGVNAAHFNNLGVGLGPANPLAGGPYVGQFPFFNMLERLLPEGAENLIVAENLPAGTLMVDFPTADGQGMESDFGRFYKLDTFLHFQELANGLKKHPFNANLGIPADQLIIYSVAGAPPAGQAGNAAPPAAQEPQNQVGGRKRRGLRRRATHRKMRKSRSSKSRRRRRA